MFVVYAKCRTCENEIEIASFDNERDVLEYAASQQRKRKDYGLRVEES